MTSCFHITTVAFLLRGGKWNSYKSGNVCNIIGSVLFKMRQKRNTIASSTIALATREMGLIELFLSQPRLIIY